MMSLLALRKFSPDNIQCAACFKPFDLLFIVSMVGLYDLTAAIRMVQYNLQRFIRCKS